MNKRILAVTIAMLFSASAAYAEDAVVAPAPEAVVVPDNVLTFNLGAITDYRYRGISQSNLKPALQGGADYTNNPTGLYAGTWLSSIKWIKDIPGGNDDVEWDIYGGKRGEIVPDVTYDVGVLEYYYPSNNLNPSANTTELYGQLGYKVVTAKYSQSVTNLFGFTDSKNSGYFDLSAAIDVTEGYTLGLHYGHQSIRNNGAFSYSDWKVGVSKDFFEVTFTAGVVGTDASKMLYVTPDQKFTGKTAAFLQAVKTF
jgi:uncharacterized protein (TIGR02001 family)